MSAYLKPILLLVMLVMYEPIGATAQSSAADSADYQALMALNQKYLESYRNGDTEFFDKVLSADFLEVASEGAVLNKAEFLAKIAARAGSIANITIEAAELSIRITDDTAIVNSIPQITGEDGVQARGGRYTDVYVRIEGDWICVAAHLGG